MSEAWRAICSSSYFKMRRDSPGLRALVEVAELLGELRESMVFVGGSTIPLLITDPGAGPARATDDVDVVVEVTTAVQYHALAEGLRRRSLREDTSDDPPVICRWIHGRHRIDVMPVDGTFLGFRGAWLRAVCNRPWTLELVPGTSIHVARAPEFLATKADAFADRGRGDFVVSKDIEDFLAIVNGRAELLQELKESPDDVRGYVCGTVAAWLEDDRFLEALPGQLHGDDASQDRLPLLLDRLRDLAKLR